MRFQEDYVYINQVLAGNTAAYSMLVNKHKDMAYGIAFKILRNHQDAEEVAQDGFVKAYHSLDKFRGESGFKTWLYRIVYNTAISKTRKKQLPVSDLEDHLVENIAENEDHSEIESLSNEEKLFALEKVIKQLPSQDQIIVNLFYLEGTKVEEISKITSLSESNVKVKLFRIRKKIYTLMEKMLVKTKEERE